MVQTDLHEQSWLVQTGLLVRTWLLQTGLLVQTELQTVILQGKDWKSLSMKLKSSGLINNFDDIHTLSTLFCNGFMTLTNDSDSLMLPPSIRYKLST